MSGKLKWAILGTGRIAHTFAQGLKHAATGELYAVGSRALESARAFGAEFGAAACFGSYEAALAEPLVQCVYLAMPHTFHAEWSIKAAEAGKHILCEKPMALNQYQAQAVFAAVKRHGVFFMEAYMYLCHPQTLKLAELVRAKTVGETRMIRASFSFAIPYDPHSRLLSNALAGGGILDVGGYAVTAGNLIAAAALGLETCEPLEFKAAGQLGKTGVDEYTAAVAKYPGGIVAEFSCAVQCEQEWEIVVYGSAGQIRVSDPWIPSKEGGTTKIAIHRTGEAKREIEVVNASNLYALEADEVGRNIQRRESPRVSRQISMACVRTLDRWRKEIGLVYQIEQPGKVAPVNARALALRPGSTMPYARIDGVEKPIARAIMGADFQETAPHMAALLDEYIERGGNAFDTAFEYQQGHAEFLLGHYLKSRGVREKIVLIGKAAHTPDNIPEIIDAQLKRSLERLHTDALDIFYLHRDNAKVPVGEWVDAVNAQVRAGRIRGAIGVSNWLPARIDEANAYAKKHGLKSFTVVSNSLSLARPLEPIWAGCVHIADEAQLEWFKRTQTPLFSWSSQARGFFTERVKPGDLSDPDVARCFNSPGNWQRKQRAEQLAAKRGVSPNEIAVAYVLCQPFPTFAVIGPRTIDELINGLGGVELKLSESEVKWLETGS